MTFSRASLFGSPQRSAPLAAVLVLLAGTILGSGCSEKIEPRERNTTDVAVTDVPENVMEQAKKSLPEVEFQEAWKVFDAKGTLEGYEVRGKNKIGKIREVRISPEGKVLEME